MTGKAIPQPIRLGLGYHVSMGDRLILFDVDGTLVDTAGAGRKAMEQACLDVFGIDGIELRAGGVNYAGRTDPVIIEAVAHSIGVAEGTLASRFKALRDSYLGSLRSEMQKPRGRVLPGVLALLESLVELSHVHLGLITGNFEIGARIKLEQYDLNRFFPNGGFSSDHRDRREIARIAVRKMSAHAGIEFSADDVCVIGDTEHDVDCAKVNGYRAVAVESGWVSRESLERAGPDVLLEDMTDRERTIEALGLAEIA